ncbi:DUF302 domain-containing protein [Nonomuraea jiangxiensis]|uniref:DUF302 domain-containing protein n=1 Tax=Nonomuraea jiangxiensis TaxID=633440 RepID=A0A1G7ZQQ0_9ACTN|nr:DUF302 domain-containing protein [Nonomuraea jiangxiensis]SDH10975.1 hypothetical protein SAMN05421869_101491 [Nonomuraea jiangxiensis]
MRNPSTPTAITHANVRLLIPLPGSFEEAVRDYERHVPALDSARVAELVRRRAPWAEVLAQAAANAPYEFMIFWRYEITPLMSLAGDRWPCVTYLMGNHSIAQRMFRHDPAVMLSAPLRTVICADASGLVTFQIDQPSSRFGSYGDPEIAAVGRELDRKLADLLDALGAPVPGELRAQP